jgi:glycosyltransferase involved in cell wall biosynthesis
MTEKKSLNVVHTEASLGWGGQEIRVLTEAAGMLQRGHRVTLLCPAEAKIYAAARERGVPVQALPIGRKGLRGIFALRRWFRANPADVINTHSSTDTWLVALASLLQATAPLVRTRHISAPVPRNGATRWLYTRATRFIVTTGEALRHQLVEDNGFPAARIRSVPTGIDISHFTAGDRAAARARLGLAREGTIVGIVATLRSWKGHQYLLEAFARLSDRSARLAIVGDGPQREAIIATAQRLHLTERLIMPGNQQDVVPWLQALDIFVLPSYANEGVPQAILQAMACALPVVSTPIGAIAEAVENETNGLLVEPRSVDALHAALERLLRDPALRGRLGAAAAQHARERFSSDRMLDAMEAVFREAGNTHG